MTLAETFLLLLFVVWYSVVRSASDTSPDILKAVAEERQKKIELLQRQLAERDRRVAELETKISWWQKYFNSDPPQSLGDLVAMLRSPQGRAVLADVGRGYPGCEDDNILVHASVARGAVSVEVLSESRHLSDWAAPSGITIPAPRAVLSGWGPVRSLLSAVDGFYASRPSGSGCRFDYRLTYETNDDYHDGRETFEHTFYPAGVSRSQQ
jgi:hypothetical protein